MEYKFVCTNTVQSFVHTRSQERGAVSPRETEPDFPLSVQASLVEAWVDSGLLRGPGAEHNSVCTRPFEGHHCHNHREHTLPPAKQRGEKTAPPINRELIQGLPSLARPTRIRPSFPPVSAIGQLPQASYPHPSEGRQSEDHSHREVNKLIIWITALSNSVKL